MLQEVFGETASKSTFLKGEKVMSDLTPAGYDNIPCEMAECIYCLNGRCCGRTYPPRNADGYCKDFVSIND